MPLDSLNTQITSCRLCPRLVAWREQVGREKRKSYLDEEYWAKPVPIFGDPNATRLIVGLAPAAHGANRTGRMFHGDRSGDWLYRALHKAGVAKLARADSIADGQELYGVMITAVCHCAPPDNKPLPEEIANCGRYLRAVLTGEFQIRNTPPLREGLGVGELLPDASGERPHSEFGKEIVDIRNASSTPGPSFKGGEIGSEWRSILCLGSIAWNQVHRQLGLKRVPFTHGVVNRQEGLPKLVASFHPSQQNTFTGKLTEPMLDAAIAEWLS